jgi:hypothetical protein
MTGHDDLHSLLTGAPSMALADFSSISGRAPPVTAETERRVGVRVRRPVQGNFCNHAKAAPLSAALAAAPRAFQMKLEGPAAKSRSNLPRE